MSAWLDSNAEGLALLFWAGVTAILVLGFAAVVEAFLASDMRKRARRTRALSRYVDSINRRPT